MRLGVIDIGSNTVHALIVDVHRGAKPLPAASHKIALRLSEHLLDDGRISPAGVDGLITFTKEAMALADDEGTEEILVLATSAVREATNGSDVLAALAANTGQEVVVLSGVDEARLTFLAARRWCGWSAGTLRVLDIGGGSLELAQGLDEEPDAAVSVQLGAGRVTRDLLPGDPPTPEVIREARKAIRARLAADLRPLVRAGEADRSVATSKTFRSLARLSGAAPSVEGPYAVRRLRRDDLPGIVDRLSQLPVARRSDLAGVSAARAAQVLGGALVAEAALDLLRIESVEICPWALREGVILRALDIADDEPGIGLGARLV